jgi:hypothetical protein
MSMPLPGKKKPNVPSQENTPTLKALGHTIVRSAATSSSDLIPSLQVHVVGQAFLKPQGRGLLLINRMDHME